MIRRFLQRYRILTDGTSYVIRRGWFSYEYLSANIDTWWKRDGHVDEFALHPTREAAERRLEKYLREQPRRRWR
jgi:hypothetical protein